MGDGNITKDERRDGGRIVQKFNIQFKQLLTTDKKINFFQGASRSGKTYSILQFILYTIFEKTKDKKYTKDNPYKIRLIRKSLNDCKESIYLDFLKIANELQLFDRGAILHKSDYEIKYKNVFIKFRGLEEQQKARSVEYNLTYANECNELTKQDFEQLSLRTTDLFIGDFNPSFTHHWIYNYCDLAPELSNLYISTWKDNAYMPQATLDQLMFWKEHEPDLYKVFGEGKRMVVSNRVIYPNFNIIDKSQIDHSKITNIFYGLDFGFSQSTTAIVKIMYDGGKNLYIEEICYKLGMHNCDIANIIQSSDYNHEPVYCDSANPQNISELKTFGINTLPANKNVHSGILKVKEFILNVIKGSDKLIFELEHYLFDITKTGTIINEPVKENDHLCDAMRYGVYTKMSQNLEIFATST